MNNLQDRRQALHISNKEDIITAMELTKEMAETEKFSATDSIFLQLATEEACVNAYEHSNVQQDKEIEVIWLVTSMEMEISVCQKGGVFEMPSYMEPNLEPRGRGLALIRIIMDEVRLITSGAYIILKMYKKKGG
jgi:serine/threonine-protein kinase RsbW